jgi:hypothetical protein
MAQAHGFLRPELSNSWKLSGNRRLATWNRADWLATLAENLQASLRLICPHPAQWPKNSQDGKPSLRGMRMFKTLATSVIALLALGGMAKAADIAPPPEPVSGWEWEIAPYGWLAGLSGEAAQFGLPEQEIDITIKQVLENLDIALMGLVQVRNERFSAFSDLVYGKLTAEIGTPHGILADKVEITSKTLMWTVGAAYSIYYEPEVGNFDLVVGGRLWSLDTEAKIKGGIFGGNEFDDGQTWVDPLVGAKGRYSLSPDFFVTGWGLIGGFDVSDDKLMWDLFGGFGYEAWPGTAIVAGYRAVSVDYHKGDFVYDTVQQGPLLGIDFRF